MAPHTKFLTGPISAQIAILRADVYRSMFLLMLAQLGFALTIIHLLS